MTTKTKHTPGPWFYAADDAGREDEYGCGERGAVDPATYKAPGYYANIGLDAANGQRIVGCSEYDVFYGETHNERVANMRLIAAAPEMLEALKVYAEFAQDFINHPQGNYVISSYWIDKLREAKKVIAKAEGRG